jgi:hypothetical protein
MRTGATPQSCRRRHRGQHRRRTRARGDARQGLALGQSNCQNQPPPRQPGNEGSLRTGQTWRPWPPWLWRAWRGRSAPPWQRAVRYAKL